MTKHQAVKPKKKAAAQPAAAPVVRDQRWQAVVARDAEADGRFVYSVKTTGVYCRPSCAARQPNPQNVAFHEDPAAAEAAGFRACKRCKPDQLAQPHAQAIAAICRLLESAEAPPKLADLAARAKLSPHHFQRVFKAALGMSPAVYFQIHRARKVRDELTEAKTVTEAIYQSGYNSSGRFYAQINDILGMTPKEFRKGGKGVVIRFAIGECSLGAILVASTDKGVCAILIGEEPDQLARELQDRFAHAEVVGGDAEYEKLVAKVVGMVENPGAKVDLPLDIHGTAFQQKVWQALRSIPPGATVTYAEVAASIHMPKAARAVGGACARNHLAMAIPCHRVVRNDGAVSGYAWGAERRKALLEKEAATAKLAADVKRRSL
jgi:AraC family transcriptional regulator, regulatory protein of adaptative response / methylated-DNA-[protein]-cysteine methyltransferase